jgi:hypothetical protein
MRTQLIYLRAEDIKNSELEFQISDKYKYDVNTIDVDKINEEYTHVLRVQGGENNDIKAILSKDEYNRILVNGYIVREELGEIYES